MLILVKKETNIRKIYQEDKREGYQLPWPLLEDQKLSS